MTFTKETQEAYCSRENPAEKVILEKDKMGLVQAIKILCSLRDGLSFCEGMGKTCEALDVVLEWVNNLFLIMGGTDNGKNDVQLMDCLGYLRAICRSHKKRSTCSSACPLYDPEERETACLLCKAAGLSLADNIVDAYPQIRRNNGGLLRGKK